jgi:hypothetical protein
MSTILIQIKELNNKMQVEYEQVEMNNSNSLQKKGQHCCRPLNFNI